MPTDKFSSNGTPTSTKVVTKQVVCRPVSELDPDIISTTKHEEWTTSRKKVNHKTKQVETRVQRQVILEDGKVVADSGPQVTTHTTEDDKTEETENTEHKTSGDDAPEEGYMLVPGSARVVSEKTETHQTMQEKKEENMQLHDESFHDLSATDIHHLALTTPSEERRPPGKMTHYSSRSQKVTDKEEVKEVSHLLDGELSTETTRTHHHEEVYDDEVPEGEVDGTALPEVSTETTRKLEYLQEGEEEIRNKETSRWLEDHFGSEDRSSAGGNVINIQLTAPPPAKEEWQDTGKRSSLFASTTPRGWTSTRRNDDPPPKTPLKTYFMGEHDSHWTTRQHTPEVIRPANPIRRSMSQREPVRKLPLLETTPFSVRQRARYFSDDSPTSQTLPRDWRRQTDKTTRYIHVELPDEKDRSHSPAFVHRPETSTLPRASHSTPRSFYFGDETDRSYRLTNGYPSRPSYGEADRSLGDVFSSDSFTKSFATGDRANGQSRRHFLRGLLDTSDRGVDVLVGSTDHVPASRKLPPEKRQNQFHTSVPPPPVTPPSSPPPRLIPVTRTDHTDLFSTRSKPPSTSNLARTRSETHVPTFTPLVSPLEILNVSTTPRYVDVKPKKRSPVMVEVRDWESR